MKTKLLALMPTLMSFNFAYAEVLSLAKFDELCAEQIKSTSFTVTLIERNEEFAEAEDLLIRSTNEARAFEKAQKKYQSVSSKEITPRVLSLSAFGQYVARKSYLAKIKDRLEVSLDPQSIFRDMLLEAPKDIYEEVNDNNIDWHVTNKKVVRSRVKFEILDKTNSQKIYVELKTKEFPLVRNSDKNSGEKYVVDAKLPIDCKFQLDTRFDNLYLSATSLAKNGL